MRVPRPSVEEQKKKIEDIVLTKSHVAVGDTWYLISKKWFQEWENYVQGSSDDGDAPGPIDNSVLINEDSTLKRGLEEYR